MLSEKMRLRVFKMKAGNGPHEGLLHMPVMVTQQCMIAW